MDSLLHSIDWEEWENDKEWRKSGNISSSKKVLNDTKDTDEVEEKNEEDITGSVMNNEMYAGEVEGINPGQEDDLFNENDINQEEFTNELNKRMKNQLPEIFVKENAGQVPVYCKRKLSPNATAPIFRHLKMTAEDGANNTRVKLAFDDKLQEEPGRKRLSTITVGVVERKHKARPRRRRSLSVRSEEEKRMDQAKITDYLRKKAARMSIDIQKNCQNP